jgi:hypothetical protein
MALDEYLAAVEKRVVRESARRRGPEPPALAMEVEENLHASTSVIAKVREQVYDLLRKR